MSYARRVDSTHREVIDTLRDIGWQVIDTSTCRCFVDCVAWHPGRQALRLVEIKDEKGKLTTNQQLLLNMGWPIAVLRSAKDAVKL